MVSAVPTGVGAITQMVAQFAQTARVKIEAQGAVKTRTQVLIEQIAMEAIERVRSGQTGVKIAQGTLNALLDVQAGGKR